ncbi:arginine/serine-rich protein PNISR [Anguilla rostrata]|uniref:arginine/serine-rich protein PNISR n=1 Tax=Anguilla rostrata TaxID=7938 RepID=UPI0030CF1E34
MLPRRSPQKNKKLPEGSIFCAMPVHQISVVPARETASNGRNSGRNREKSKEAESEKPPRRSGSRSSNISKASSSTTGLGHTSVSRTSVTPSSQDICSSSHPLPKVEEDCVEERTPVTVLSRSGQPAGKRQVKKRHRRKRDVPRGGGENSGGSDPQEECVKYRGNPRRERDSSDSSSDEEESWREAHNWVRERPRRGRGGRGRRDREQAWDEGRDMELVSVESRDGPKTNEGARTTPPSMGQEEAGRPGLKNRRKPPANQEERGPSPAPSASQKAKSGSFEEILSSGRSHGSSSPQEEDCITRMYEEIEAGEVALFAAPCPPSSPPGLNSACPAGNSSTAQRLQCSDDELEVCRSVRSVAP